MVLLMWGFAGFFFMLFKDPVEGQTDQFSTLTLSMLTMFNYATGGTAFYVKCESGREAFDCPEHMRVIEETEMMRVTDFAH